MNGEFGDWNAFSTSPSAPVKNAITDLFGSVQSAPAPASNPAPPSADLFDLMGGANHHAMISASQSMTFTVGGASSGPCLPLSHSHQVQATYDLFQVHSTLCAIL